MLFSAGSTQHHPKDTRIQMPQQVRYPVRLHTADSNQEAALKALCHKNNKFRHTAARQRQTLGEQPAVGAVVKRQDEAGSKHDVGQHQVGCAKQVAGGGERRVKWLLAGLSQKC